MSQLSAALSNVQSTQSTRLRCRGNDLARKRRSYSLPNSFEDKIPCDMPSIFLLTQVLLQTRDFGFSQNSFDESHEIRLNYVPSRLTKTWLSGNSDTAPAIHIQRMYRYYSANLSAVQTLHSKIELFLCCRMKVRCGKNSACFSRPCTNHSVPQTTQRTRKVRC